MKHYDELKSIFNRIYHISHFISLGSWDNSVMIPKGSMKARSEATSELVKIVAESLTDPSVKTLIEQAEQENLLTGWDESNLREMKRTFDKYNKVDTELLVETSKASSECEAAWREYRGKNDFKSLMPYIQKLLDLSKKQAAQLQAGNKSLYDSLMDSYEPELTTKIITPLFDDLKSFLPESVELIVEEQSKWESIKPISIPVTIQKNIGLEVMNKLGFDFNKGRVDESHHPFCGGVSEDVRITSRYDEDNFVEGLYAIIHETGHACYEQGLPREVLGQPVAKARSLGIHEGQSLLFEKQLAKSDEFIEFLVPIFKKHLPKEDITKQFLKQSILKVNPGKIRVNADEVTYPLHIVLRYEIEKALIEGELSLSDVPEAWDHKMKAYLGVSTLGDDQNGCMQDIHWMMGAFGYFPTYTLGAMNAAQLFYKFKEETPGWQKQTKEGDFKNLKSWLTDKVWSQASYYKNANELMLSATGEALDSDYFKSHIRSRYLKL